MTHSNSDTSDEISSEVLEVLKSQSEELKELESKYDAILAHADQELERVENEMNIKLENGEDEKKCVEEYAEATAAIKTAVTAQVKALEESYKEK